MATTKTDCPVSREGGCICKGLRKLGVCRSTLITLALIPFAWSGVTWVVDAVRSLFDLVSGVGS